MKKRLLSILVLLSLLCSCSPADKVDNNERYSIKTIDNEQYLIIDDGLIESLETEIVQVATIQFDSVDGFVNTVNGGKLTDHQLAIANKTFKKDENGIKVCDFSNIHVPSVPSEFECESVYWSGEQYSFSLESANDNTIAYVHLLDKSTYDYQYENDYLRFFENELLRTTKVVENGNKTEYYYSTAVADLKTVRYTVTDAERNLIIEESYRLRIDDDALPVSQDVPSKITVYCAQADVYFIIAIFDVANKPTAEWLTQFGVKAYK